MIEPNYLTNAGYYTLGLGIFHSGVEIGEKEFCFGGHNMPNITGVFVVKPKTGIPELFLKRTIDLGQTRLTDKEIQELLVRLSDEFSGPSYNLLTRNCNHFTEELSYALTRRSIPFWINRAARLGNMFPCVVPWDWIQPPECAEEEEDNEEEEQIKPSVSRRPSAVSLLSNKHHRSYTEGRGESQERLLPPLVSFQGIAIPASSETASPNIHQ
ncbi:PPPDE putative peptidase domain-containing protein [Sporodiniella umbellata]|nr:PPPDE putative peptidase domain-containing protein [Sporodiniella umbellata]